VYNVNAKEFFPDIDLILSCGDLPFYYLEFLVTVFNVPVLFVFGNHHTHPMLNASGSHTNYPAGCINVDNCVVNCKGVLIGGLEGCMLYNFGPKQYSEYQMRRKIGRMKPQLWKNKLFQQRYLDILITHAPPFGIHDKPDRCHVGFRSFLTFLRKYQPRYHVHGHTHRYTLKDEWKSQYLQTTVINTCGYRVLEIEE